MADDRMVVLQHRLELTDLDVVIDTERPLGTGSYGAVYRAAYRGEPCAAKVLHPCLALLQDEHNSGHAQNVPLARFRQECDLLRRIRHPNIIRYLTTCQTQGSNLPVLVMEVMETSLTRHLETLQRDQHTLLFRVQVGICHDVASAISFLHANHYIHRDLSSNNVLLCGLNTGEVRAKVSDFGTARLLDPDRQRQRVTYLTQCPGSMVYMPPESLDERPRYTNKVDCFSYGVLVVQLLT